MSINLPAYTVGPIGATALRFFRIGAHKPLQRRVMPIAENATPYLRELYRGEPFEISRPDPPIHIKATSADKRIAYVGFSGGKDSTALAIKLQKAGHEVRLFHVKGINPAYPDEENAARATAGLLGMRMIQMRVKLGPQEYIENPTKNQVILGLMIDAGLRMGAGTYAMGVMTTEEAADVAFDFGYSDAIEMQRAAKATYEGMVEGITVETELLRNEIDSYRTILNHDAGLLATIQSCMTPLRFRGVHHKRNRARFGGAVLPNRCGSCYKCAQEILILRDLDYLDPSDALTEHAETLLVRNATNLIGEHAKALSREQVVGYFTREEKR